MLLADWAIRNIRQDPPEVRVRRRLIPAAIRLLDQFEPTTLLLPDIGPHGVRRSANVREVIEAVTREARERGVDVVAVSEHQVKDAFEQVRPGVGRNKQTVYDIIVEWFPEVRSQRPKARRLWDSEGHAVPLFDSIARWCAWRGVPARKAS